MKKNDTTVVIFWYSLDDISQEIIPLVVKQGSPVLAKELSAQLLDHPFSKPVPRCRIQFKDLSTDRTTQ